MLERKRTMKEEGEKSYRESVKYRTACRNNQWSFFFTMYLEHIKIGDKWH